MHLLRTVVAACSIAAALACLPPAGTSTPTPRLGPRAETACAIPTSTPQAEGLDAARVARLIDSARATNSDAIVVLRNGKLIGEWYSDSGRVPIQTMSV